VVFRPIPEWKKGIRVIRRRETKELKKVLPKIFTPIELISASFKANV